MIAKADMRNTESFALDKCVRSDYTMPSDRTTETCGGDSYGGLFVIKG